MLYQAACGKWNLCVSRCDARCHSKEFQLIHAEPLRTSFSHLDENVWSSELELLARTCFLSTILHPFSSVDSVTPIVCPPINFKSFTQRERLGHFICPAALTNRVVHLVVFSAQCICNSFVLVP